MTYGRETTAALITRVSTVSASGFETVAETEKMVFCRLKSATRAEFYAAIASGLRVDCVAEVSAYDYNGEDRVKIEGNTYKVTRAYVRGDDIAELSLTKVGEFANGG